jgi:hypothetical protein
MSRLVTDQPVRYRTGWSIASTVRRPWSSCRGWTPGAAPRYAAVCQIDGIGSAEGRCQGLTIIRADEASAPDVAVTVERLDPTPASSAMWVPSDLTSAPANVKPYVPVSVASLHASLASLARLSHFEGRQGVSRHASGESRGDAVLVRFAAPRSAKVELIACHGLTSDRRLVT